MSTNQLICIKRPEPGLSALFEDMYLNERLVDVTLSCCDGQLQAHKLVLAACSSYFSNLFDKLANPFHYPVIVIKDMLIDDLKMIVDFMYRGQLTLTQERLITLVRSAENLQITGLSNVGELIANSANGTIVNNNQNNSNRVVSSKFKRGKKSLTMQHQAFLSRTYQPRQNDVEFQLSPHADKLMEQSMVTGGSIDGNHEVQQFSYTTNDPTSTRNLNNQQLQIPSPSAIHAQHIQRIDSQQQQQLTNQLQVLSHSLNVNRSSTQTNNNNSSQQSIQIVQQPSRTRLHPCNICWKTFREKANLKRHLQVHSLDRIIYACPDCNKTFSWKDNYIRHTKTAHHINNARPQT